MLPALTDKLVSALRRSVQKMLPKTELADKAMENTLSQIKMKLGEYDKSKMKFTMWAFNIARDECLKYLPENHWHFQRPKINGFTKNSYKLQWAFMDRVLIELIHVRKFSIDETAILLRQSPEAIKLQVDNMVYDPY